MPKVEVELEDLEALIYASGAIKKIESFIASYKRDPFVQGQAEKFIPAQKRLEGIVTNAKRAAAKKREDTVIHIDDPLPRAHAVYLAQIFSHRDQSGYVEVPLREKDFLDMLSARGMIETGQLLYGGQWTGDEHPVINIVPGMYMVRFTLRGEEEAKRWGGNERPTRILGQSDVKALP